MLRHSYHPLILTIIGLAILGIGYNLVRSPGAFFTQILITAGIVVLLIFVMKKFILPRLMRSQAPYGQPQSMYTQKSQSTKRPATFSSKKKDKKKRISRPLVKRQSDVKLTVIEGKKNKKKNRALF
ncbi:hypothetical protein J2S74_003687 [Evansella vedderi]|uniref:Uncharacterized protein n=1 Tax=Evansella vedderi TaxID=38282 RepID=A0ABT9ZZI8_9BACI|nr:SA1362 family protein [Evansella vedderi]MDQ0256269.1 hypothetical protein [Evansella vedderi]